MIVFFLFKTCQIYIYSLIEISLYFVLYNLYFNVQFMNKQGFWSGGGGGLE